MYYLRVKGRNEVTLKSGFHTKVPRLHYCFFFPKTSIFDWHRLVSELGTNNGEGTVCLSTLI